MINIVGVVIIYGPTILFLGRGLYYSTEPHTRKNQVIFLQEKSEMFVEILQIFPADKTLKDQTIHDLDLQR